MSHHGGVRSGQKIGGVAAGGAGADHAQIVGFEVRERLPGLGIVQHADHLEQPPYLRLLE